jgi:hypothetical protein
VEEEVRGLRGMWEERGGGMVKDLRLRADQEQGGSWQKVERERERGSKVQGGDSRSAEVDLVCCVL